MSVLKFLNPGKRKLPLLSREEVEKLDKKVPGTNTNSNRTVTESKKRAKTTVKVKEDTRAANRRISKQLADEATERMAAKRERLLKGIQEQPVSLQQSDAYASSHGEIKDGNQTFLDKAMSWYGLSNGLGLTTNISDRWRATPSFANFVGKDTPNAMAMAGSLVANPVGTVLGMGTGYLGSQAGGYIGELLGNREAGEIAGSLVGMPFGYKVGTTLQRTVPNYYRNYTLARAINQGVRETPIQSTFEPVVRTKVGDVEIDNPELYYHQSGAGKALHFMETGRMRTPTEEYWLAKEAAGEHIPVRLRTGIKPGYPQVPGRAMFSQGSLWYGFDPRGNPDLLVTAKEMPIATRKAGIMSDKASLKKLESQGSRRVTDDNIYGLGPHNTQNTSAYTWEPGYGYRQVSEQPPTYNHPGAFLGNTVKENGGITVNGEGVLRRPYQKPESSDWMLLELKEPLMADKPKLSRGQFETLFNSGKIKKPEDLYKYMTTTLAGRIFKMASNVKKALGKFSSSNLHDKKDLLYYNAVLERSTQGLKGTRGTSTAIRQTLADEKARTSEGQYNLYLNNDDALVLEEIRRQTLKDYGNQISFNEFLGGILASQNIPKAVAVTPIEIPGVGKFPLMERYLHNARERAELLLPDLIRKGYMYVDPNTKMWVGRYNINDKAKPVDPALFVLSFINNIRNSSNRVPVFREYSRAGTRELVLPIAWHGTSMGDKPLFTQYKNPTNIKPIFTTVSDGMPGSSNVKEAYQRGGTSIPFLFKRKTYNGRTYLGEYYEPMNEGGSKSTGYILKDGTSIGLLKDHFSGGKGGGTARYVYDVSDLADIPHNSPQPQTEYIFGVGTPEVKSLLNTGDYLPYFNEEGKLIEGVTPFNKRGGKITINNL